MLTLSLPENSQQNAWQEVKQGLFNIQRIGIQKFGVDGYTNENSINVYEYLYNSISLNSSSVMYQPFAGLATEGKSNESITRYFICFCLLYPLLMAWTGFVAQRFKS